MEEVGLVAAEAGVEVLEEVGLPGEEAAAWVLVEAGGEVLAEAGLAVAMVCRSPMVVTHTMDMAYRSLTAVTHGKQ